MKKAMRAVCAGIAVVLTSACADDGRPKERAVGGWSSAAVTDTNVISAATFAVKAQEKALRAQSRAETVRLELKAIRAAAQQVVAGMNYRLTLTVRLDGKEKTAEAIVWWQPWRKPDPYQLSSWSWK